MNAVSELQTYSPFSQNFYGFWRYFTDLPGRFSFPFVFWLGFFWKETLGMLGTNPTAPAADKRGAKSTKKRA